MPLHQRYVHDSRLNKHAQNVRAVCTGKTCRGHVLALVKHVPFLGQGQNAVLLVRVKPVLGSCTQTKLAKDRNRNGECVLRSNTAGKRNTHPCAQIGKRSWICAVLKATAQRNLGRELLRKGELNVVFWFDNALLNWVTELNGAQTVVVAHHWLSNTVVIHTQISGADISVVALLGLRKHARTVLARVTNRATVSIVTRQTVWHARAHSGTHHTHIVSTRVVVVAIDRVTRARTLETSVVFRARIVIATRIAISQGCPGILVSLVSDTCLTLVFRVCRSSHDALVVNQTPVVCHNLDTGVVAGTLANCAWLVAFAFAIVGTAGAFQFCEHTLSRAGIACVAGAWVVVGAGNHRSHAHAQCAYVAVRARVSIVTRQCIEVRHAIPTNRVTRVRGALLSVVARNRGTNAVAVLAMVLRCTRIAIIARLDRGLVLALPGLRVA